MLVHGQELRSEAAVSVCEPQEVVEDPIRPLGSGSATDGVLVLGEVDEVVEGGVEELETGQAVTEPGRAVGFGSG